MVARTYGEWLAALAGGQAGRADARRSFLRKGLTAAQWEYMTWQEWKEGLARYLENRLNARLRLPPEKQP
jgi:hypothetical protein